MLIPPSEYRTIPSWLQPNNLETILREIEGDVRKAAAKKNAPELLPNEALPVEIRIEDHQGDNPPGTQGAKFSIEGQLFRSPPHPSVGPLPVMFNALGTFSVTPGAERLCMISVHTEVVDFPSK